MHSLSVYSLYYMVMYKAEKHVFKESGISFYMHFRMMMKDKMIQTVFLSELIELKKLSRERVN